MGTMGRSRIAEKRSFALDTYSGRNDYLIRHVVSGGLNRYRTDLSSGHHIAVDVGPGAVPLTSIDLARALDKLNHNIRLVVTELPDMEPMSHDRSPLLFNKFSTEISLHYFKDIGTEARLNDLFLVKDRSGRYQQMIIGFECEERQYFKTIAADPSSVLGMRLGRDDPSGYSAGLYDRMLDIYERTSYTDSQRSVTLDPLRNDLKKVNAEFYSTEDPGTIPAINDYGGASVIFASNVTIFMGPKEESAFVRSMRKALRPDGLLLVNNSVIEGDEYLAQLKVFGKGWLGRMTELERLYFDLSGSPLYGVK